MVIINFINLLQVSACTQKYECMVCVETVNIQARRYPHFPVQSTKKSTHVIFKGEEWSSILLKLMETAGNQALEQRSVLHQVQEPLFRTAALDVGEKVQSFCSAAELLGDVRQVANACIHKSIQAPDFKGKRRTLVLILEVGC